VLVIVILLDTVSNLASNVADMAHGLPIASGPNHENEYEPDDDCEHEHERCLAEA
jgi:hypothetical protein